MTCTHCAAAQARKHYGGLQRDCPDCQVRELAKGPAYFEAEQAGAITPDYRADLQRIFGGEWRAGHDRVKTERDRLRAMK